MDTFGTIVKSLGEVALIGLLFGAGLPIIFAAGIRMLADGEPNAGGTITGRDRVYTVIGYLLTGIVALTVLIGIVYIAKDFILHTFDVSLFGAKKKGH
jgi:hypothetical protein